jgi:hypothetical protein
MNADCRECRLLMHVDQVIWVGKLGVVPMDESLLKAKAHFTTLTD